MTLLIRIVILVSRLLEAQPSIGVVHAIANVCAAQAASTPHLPAELLLAIAAIESDFDPRAISRPHGDAYPIYCSVLQTAAMSEAECRAQQPLDAGYRAGVRELRTWMRDHRVRNARVLLLAHGCGNYGIATGRCNRYPERVLAVAGRLSR